MKKKIISLLVVGGMVLSLTSCGSKENIHTSNEINEEDEEKGVSQEIGEDFEADVKAGVLWINEQGRVTDKAGNIIDAYSYIICDERNVLRAENNIMPSYTVTDDMQIVVDEEYMQIVEEDANDPNFTTVKTYYDSLLDIAGPSREGQKLGFEETDYLAHMMVYLADNGSPYYPDIIYGNYWEDGVNGIPLADPNGRRVYMPETIADIISGSEISADSEISKLRLIDQSTCTIDQIKRSDPSDLLYTFYVQNIKKDVDSHGNVYFEGFVDLDYVVVYGDFDKLLNGDDVFVYAAYNGLNVNDIPIFDGAYIEILN